MAPDRYDRSRRGVWSHWVPLVLTVTVATAGLAAWVWSQRKDEDDDHGGYDHETHEPGLDYENADYGDNPPYGATNRDQRSDRRARQSDDAYGASASTQQDTHLDSSAPTWGARMSGALRRTPSPQQFLDSTGKTVAAGVAAAGAAMGKALASIREEDKQYGENPWSEEADAKRERAPIVYDKKRKTVAVVVSADAKISDHADDDGTHELASILSHVPRHIDFAKTKLYVLIYAPNLQENALEATSSSRLPPSLSSSFSNIGYEQAQAPGEESKSGVPNNNAAFNAVYSQALALVEKEPMILPFTTPNGHIHILRHIQPEIVYLQESLSGDNGSLITNLQTWMRHDVILIVGAESGSGGLADSESEAEKSSKPEQWWQKTERVGRGRGVVVVDSMRVHDDWARRVQGQE